MARQGYGSRWQKARAYYLAHHPACVLCGALATVVDHIIPHKGDPLLFWDQANWQPLCRSCHSWFTAKYDGRWGKRRDGKALAQR